MNRVGQTLIGAAGLGVALVALMSSQASATPTCTSTTTLTASAAVADSLLVGGTGQSNGGCVAAGDKLFGNFTFGPTGNQLPFSGQITQFNFPTSSPFIGEYQIAFSTNLERGLTASQFGYEVMVNDPTVALIDDFQKDASFNGASGSSISLTGSINGAQLINCTRTLSGVTVGTECPQIVTFTAVPDVIVRENATTSAGPTDPNTGAIGATITNVTDTISQVVPTTGAPEPASLVLLGTALVGFGVVGVRRRRKAA